MQTVQDLQIKWISEQRQCKVYRDDVTQTLSIEWKPGNGWDYLFSISPLDRLASECLDVGKEAWQLVCHKHAKVICYPQYDRGSITLPGEHISDELSAPGHLVKVVTCVIHAVTPNYNHDVAEYNLALL